MKTLSFSILLFLLSFGLFAQNTDTTIDSLMTKLSTLKTDVEKEKTYRKLSEVYSYYNPDSSVYFGLKSLDICNKNPQIKDKEYVYYLMGEASLDISLDTARIYFFKSIAIANQVKNDSVKNLAYIGMSAYHSNFSNIDSTLYYNEKAKKYFESTKNYQALTICYKTMMSIYSMVGDLEKTTIYGEKCVNLIENGYDNPLDGEIYISLSFAYSGIDGDENSVKAVTYLEKAEKIALAKNQSYLLLNIYQVKGINFYREKKYKSAIPYFHKSLDVATQIGDVFNVSISHFNLGGCYFRSGDMKNADIHYSKVDEIEGGSRQKRTYLYLSLIHSNKNHEKSLMYLAKFDSTKKVLNVKNEKELLIKYESLEKEKENLALTIENKNKELETQSFRIQAQKNKFYLILGILSFVTISALALFYFFYKRKQSKNKIINLQKQALQLQLNPHFFFNALNSINSYIGEKNTDKSKYYLGKFSGLMRLTLENSQFDEVNLEDELEFLENYMILEQMNSNNFEYQIDVNDDLLELKIPSMLLQPFVENSIEHAFNGLEDKGKLTIKITEVSDFLKVTITDNGVGIKNQTIDKTHKSVAIELLQKRIKLYSKGKSKITYQIPFPNHKNVGAQVRFSIPINLNSTI